MLAAVIFTFKSRACELHDCNLIVKNLLHCSSKTELSCQQITTIMYYEFHNKLSKTGCHRKMSESSDINNISYDMIKVWFWKFKTGNFDIDDKPHSGHPIGS